MPAEGLKKAVLDKARSDAEEAVAAAKKNAEATIAAATDRAESESAAIVDGAKRDAEQLRSRELSSLDRELRLAGLKEKNDLLDKVFAEAAALFGSASPDDLKALYAKELEGVELSGAEVVIARGATAQFEAARGKGATIKEDDAVKGGYIVTRADYRLDRSLAARISELEASMRGELAQILFAEKT